MTQGRRVRLVLLGLAALFATPEAHAFCRSRACDDPDPKTGERDPELPDCQRRPHDRCPTVGKFLYWPQSCISFSVQRDGSKSDGIDYQTMHDVVSAGFDAWLAADCGGDKPSFAILDHGPVECGSAAYNEDAPNANVFMFRALNWVTDDAELNPIALTTVSFDKATGAIYDADVEFNSARANFVVGEPQATETNLGAVVTHEIGHFLGLSHSDVGQATMWDTYVWGVSDQRTLHTDDMAGICELFPPARPVNTKNCEPRHGFSSVCKEPPPDEGCAVKTGNGGKSGSGTPLLLLGLGLLRVLRRRRRSEIG